MKVCATCKTAYPSDFQLCPKDGDRLRVISDLQPGIIIREKYEILERVGAGGMATVYRAKHLPFSEICALKLIRDQLTGDETFSQRLRNEAMIARKLNHPHAVRIQDLDRTEDGRPFIVMEYVEGTNLQKVIRESGGLATSRALHITEQVASALSAAHKLGIVHRDIKPDNIQLVSSREGDFVKVLDFGIAKLRRNSLEGQSLTGSNLLVGTPQYASPEQAMGKQSGEIDGRSDLYSLGIVLYEMLTGRTPFQSDTPMGMLVHHIQTEPVPPEEMRPELNIPHPVSELLMKLLRKRLEERFQSADELIAAIKSVEEEMTPRPRVQIEPPAVLAPQAAAEPPSITELAPYTRAAEPTSESRPAITQSAEMPARLPHQDFEHDFTPTEKLARVASATAASVGLPDWEPPPPASVYPQTLANRGAANTPPAPMAAPLEPEAPPYSALELQPDMGQQRRIELLAAAYEGERKWPRLYLAAAFVLLLGAGMVVWIWHTLSKPQSGNAALPAATQPSPAVSQAAPALGSGAEAKKSPAARATPGVAKTVAPIPAPLGATASSSKAAPGVGAAGGTGTAPDTGEVKQGTDASASSTFNAPRLALQGNKAPTTKRPSEIQALLVSARHFSDSGDYKAAIEKFDQVLQLEPNNAQALAGKRLASQRQQLEERLNPEQP